MGYRHLDELHADWRRRRAEIERRLRDFRHVGEGTDRSLFMELAFCILAVQSSARRSDEGVRELAASGLLRRGSERELAAFLRTRTRFHNHKAAYIVAARERFFGGDATFRGLLRQPPNEARDWLAHEVDGIGYKEASHFLRNVGRGEDFAILDRHILRNLHRHGVLRGIPDSLSRKSYLAIEEEVRAFSGSVGIPMAAIDLLFWSRETGQVFK